MLKRKTNIKELSSRTRMHLKSVGVEKRSQPFNLEVSYPVSKAFTLDLNIRNAVGRPAHSTGADVGKPPKGGRAERDMVFSFKTEKALNNAIKRVKALKKKLPSIRFKTWED